MRFGIGSVRPPPRAAPVQSLAKGFHPKGSDVLELWADPCRLDRRLLEQQRLEYDLSAFPFVEAAREVIGCSTHDLNLVHEETPPMDVTEIAPPLRRAQVQARIGAAVTKAETKNARNLAWQFDRRHEWRAFLNLYRRFVLDWVMPQLGNVPLLYQRKPILRVVLPGSVRPTAMHCDADYFHSSQEVNYWVPLSQVSGPNSLWSESAPGAGDFAPFEAVRAPAHRRTPRPFGRDFPCAACVPSSTSRCERPPLPTSVAVRRRAAGARPMHPILRQSLPPLHDAQSRSCSGRQDTRELRLPCDSAASVHATQRVCHPAEQARAQSRHVKTRILFCPLS
jgi:hypothetical protein